MGSPVEHTSVRADLAEFLVRALDEAEWEDQGVPIISPAGRPTDSSSTTTNSRQGGPLPPTLAAQAPATHGLAGLLQELL